MSLEKHKRMVGPMYKIIISNGVFRFHLLSAAVEAKKRGTLASFLTGAYPKGLIRKLLDSPLVPSRRARRFSDRADGNLSDFDVKPIWAGECVIQLAVLLGKIFRRHDINDSLHSLGLWIYGQFASQILRRERADIYHYRAGYGGRSLARAKNAGMICLCDHSVVSPLVLDYMIKNSGQTPPRGQLSSETLSPMWKRVFADIEAADHILANSQLVKNTLLLHGIPENRVSVIYQGLDDKFGDYIGGKVRTKPRGSILFAGEISRRKGFDTLIEALSGMSDESWELVVAGGVNENSARVYKDFLARKNVRHVGFVSREELSDLMSSASIFLFPTLAEGSARVVFEALACGCYVITTRNAGSIVKTDVNGALVEPGDAVGTRLAIIRALNDPQYCQSVGEGNRSLMRSLYNQTQYGIQLDRLYEGLLENSTAHKR